VSYPVYCDPKDTPKIVLENASTVEIERTGRNVPHHLDFPRIRRIKFMTEISHMTGRIVDCWNVQTRERTELKRLELAEARSEDVKSREAARWLLRHEGKIRSWDLGQMDGDEAAAVMEKFGETIEELVYGFYNEPRFTLHIPKGDVHLYHRTSNAGMWMRLLSEPVDKKSSRFSDFAEGLTKLSNLRTLDIGSQAPLADIEGTSVAQVHSSWMKIPFSFAPTLTSLSLTFERFDSSIFDFAAVFSTSLTSLSLSFYGSLFESPYKSLEALSPTPTFPFVRRLRLGGDDRHQFSYSVLDQLSPRALPALEVLQFRWDSYFVAEELPQVSCVDDHEGGIILRRLEPYTPSGGGGGRLRQFDLEVVEQEVLDIYDLPKKLEAIGVAFSYSWTSSEAERQSLDFYSQDSEGSQKRYVSSRSITIRRTRNSRTNREDSPDLRDMLSLGLGYM
jgi:hypothetical protein